MQRQGQTYKGFFAACRKVVLTGSFGIGLALFPACGPQTNIELSNPPQAVLGETSIASSTASAEISIDSGPASGASISLPAGTLAVGTIVSSGALPAPPQSFTSTSLAQASPAVEFSASSGGQAVSEAPQPFTISLPIDATAAALSFALVQTADPNVDNLCALGATVDNKLIVWRREQLQINAEGTLASYQAKVFGTFQLVYCGQDPLPGFVESSSIGQSGSSDESPSEETDTGTATDETDDVSSTDTSGTDSSAADTNEPDAGQDGTQADGSAQMGDSGTGETGTSGPSAPAQPPQGGGFGLVSVAVDPSLFPENPVSYCLIASQASSVLAASASEQLAQGAVTTVSLTAFSQAPAAAVDKLKLTLLVQTGSDAAGCSVQVGDSLDNALRSLARTRLVQWEVLGSRLSEQAVEFTYGQQELASDQLELSVGVPSDSPLIPESAFAEQGCLRATGSALTQELSFAIDANGLINGELNWKIPRPAGASKVELFMGGQCQFGQPQPDLISGRPYKLQLLDVQNTPINGVRYITPSLLTVPPVTSTGGACLNVYRAGAINQPEALLAETLLSFNTYTLYLPFDRGANGTDPESSQGPSVDLSIDIVLNSCAETPLQSAPVLNQPLGAL